MGQPKTVNRREFVSTAAGTALVVIGCGGMVSCSGMGGAAPAFPSGPVDIGSVADYPRDQAYDTFAKSRGFFVVRQQGRIYATSSVCTHRHCIVEKGSSELVCPCHGSHFNLSGSVTDGPAPRALPRLAISHDATGQIIVDPARTFDEKGWSDPAAFVTL